MTDMTATITTTTVPTYSARRTLSLAGLASGAAAAVATTGVAAVADAIDHPLTVDGEMIPVLGFAQTTLIGAVLGVLLALALLRRVDRPQRTFTIAAWVLTALSCIPSVTMGAGDGVVNAATLVATHVLAAAIVIPVLAARIPSDR